MADEERLIKKSCIPDNVVRNVMISGLILALAISGLFTNGLASQATEKSTFVIASSWAPASIDTTVEGYTFTWIGVAETLIAVDYDHRLIPMLASSWKVSDDGLTWTFKLREDVKFHDGTPLTSEEAKKSLERTFRVADGYNTLPIKSISAIDKYTLEIATTTPFAPLPGYLARDGAAIIAPSSFDNKDEVVKPIGTGPFKFDSWVPNDRVNAVRFDDYWGTLPSLEKVTYLGVPEEKTRINMLKAGEVDMAWLLSTDTAKSLSSDPECKVYTQTIIGRVNQLMFNTNKPPLDDVRVRKAISLAIDRDLICKSILNEVVLPAAGPFASDLYWSDQNIKPISYDIETAKSLLDESGWLDKDQDGIREKDGMKLELNLFTYSGRPELPAIAEVLKDQLGKVGIKVSINVLDSTTILDYAKAGKVDLTLMSRSTFYYNDPDSWASDFLPGTSYEHYTNYAPKDLEDLIQTGRATTDDDERKKIYDKMQERILEDIPVAYITYSSHVTAVGSDINGYREHPTEFCFHLENVTKG